MKLGLILDDGTVFDTLDVEDYTDDSGRILQRSMNRSLLADDISTMVERALLAPKE